jgi:hypothetical protein
MIAAKIWTVINGNKSLLKHGAFTKEEIINLLSDELSENNLIIDISIIYIKHGQLTEHQIRIKEE